MTAAIAPETDRLVWAVADRVKARHASGEVEVMQELPDTAFSRLFNLIPFLHAGVDEDFVRRRYVYASADEMSALLSLLAERRYLIRGGDLLRTTEAFEAARVVVDSAVREAAQFHWAEQHGLVEAAVVPARQVLEASSDRGVLVDAALALPESDEPCQRLFERLTALRLVRNEAHVKAWRAHSLYPGEVEVLTARWSGSKVQASPRPTDLMLERGLVADGQVTQKGLDLRRSIEDDTNAAVAAAFAVIDQPEFLDTLRSLPG